MSSQNTKNQRDSLEAESPISKRVLEIVSYDEIVERLSGIWLKTNESIDNILWKKKYLIHLISVWYSDIYEALTAQQKSDKDICKALISSKVDLYYLLPEKHKKSMYFWKIAIESFVREWRSFLEVEAFLWKYFKEDRKAFEQLLSFYEQSLSKSQTLYKSDLSKWLLTVRSKNKPFFDLLKSRKVFSSDSKSIELSPNFEKPFLDFFLKSIWAWENVQWDDISFVLDLVISYLWLSLKDLLEDDLFVLRSIASIFLSKKLEKELKEKRKKDEKSQSEAKEKKEKEEALLDEDIWEVDLGYKLDFCLPNCSYSSLWNENFSIDTNFWKSVSVSREELDRFTSAGLQNFINFYNTLYALNLNFLRDKHKTDLVKLLNNQIWFNYPDWDGVTSSRLTRFLNFLARALWIVWNVWWKVVDEFKTLEWAKNAFETIKDTRKIGNMYYPNFWWLNDTPVVEQALKNMWYINNGELSISKFYQDDSSISLNLEKSPELIDLWTSLESSNDYKIDKAA